MTSIEIIYKFIIYDFLATVLQEVFQLILIINIYF
jgi:hypothetical protein